MQGGQDKDSPLAQEFLTSLKQVRVKYAAFKMKSEDRTFTNLSKTKLAENEIENKSFGRP